MKNSKFLFDTNILAFSQNKDHVNFKISRKLHNLVKQEKIEGFITPQNLFELFAVLTTSAIVEKNLDPIDAWKICYEYEKRTNFQLIVPTDFALSFVDDFIIHTNCRGRRIFDLYLAATGLASGVFQILTDNEKDFAGLPSIKAINPFKEKIDR